MHFHRSCSSIVCMHACIVCRMSLTHMGLNLACVTPQHPINPSPMLDETPDCRTCSSLFEQNPSDMGLGKKNPNEKNCHFHTSFIHDCAFCGCWFTLAVKFHPKNLCPNPHIHLFFSIRGAKKLDQTLN
jgi:hypothetical protein